MDMGLPKGLERPLATPPRLCARDRERFEAYLSETEAFTHTRMADEYVALYHGLAMHTHAAS